MHVTELLNQNKALQVKRDPVFRAFNKFVVDLDRILAVHFVMGAIVLFPIPVLRGHDLVSVLLDDRHAIRLGGAD